MLHWVFGTGMRGGTRVFLVVEGGCCLYDACDMGLAWV